MNNDYILHWWIKKYTPSIVTFINANVEYKDLKPEALEDQRKRLMLEYVDESDGGVFEYLIQHVPDFFDRLYKAIYGQK